MLPPSIIIFVVFDPFLLCDKVPTKVPQGDSLESTSPLPILLLPLLPPRDRGQILHQHSVDCDDCPLSSFWCLFVNCDDCDDCEDQVSSPPGSVIGTVEQEWSCLYPRFASSHFFISHQSWDVVIFILTIRFVIKDEAGSEILKIEGPLCPCSCCGDVDFNVREFKSSLSGKNIQIYMYMFVPKSCSGRVCVIFR